jgi:hypothetical protein
MGSASQLPDDAPGTAHKRRRLAVVVAVVLVAALVISLILVLGGGRSDHSYTAGYATGVGLGEQATEAPGMVSGTPSAICKDFIRTMPQGDNEGQWLQGCEAAVKEYGPGPTSTG